MITAVTPTADRPEAFALCERWMARQTVKPDAWIVADGGSSPTRCTMGQIQVRDWRHPGAENLGRNLLNALAEDEAKRAEVIVFIEDDDWYAPTHIESLAAALDESQAVMHPYPIIAGAHEQRYYHVGRRVWRKMTNSGHASLCQTAIRRVAAELLEQAIRQCLAAKTYHFDCRLWQAVPRTFWAPGDPATCVGIKGLPGQAGLGIGHRPAGLKWTADPHLLQLRHWIGDDYGAYAHTTY